MHDIHVFTSYNYTDDWFVLGITGVHMWLKYCLLIGHSTYKLIISEFYNNNNSNDNNYYYYLKIH